MTYFITGASRGIGLELTRQALQLGNKVIAAVRNPAAASELQALKGPSSSLSIIELDASSDKSVEAALQSVKGAIDVLINNAGVYLDHQGGGLKRLALSDLEQTLQTNTLGPVRVTRAALPMLSMAQNPKVVNVSSLMGSITDNRGGGSYAYRMSKTALNMFTKNLALENPSWVVVSLHPGWVQTEMGGAGATLTPKESAAGIIKLIENAKTRDSGRFFDYTGHELPW